MKTFVNALLVAAAIWLVVSPFKAGPPDKGIIANGSATRRKYLEEYDTGLRQAAKDFAVRLKSNEFKDSFSAVQAWSKMAAAVGKEASKGVDAQVAKVCELDDLAAQVRWVEEFAK